MRLALLPVSRQTLTRALVWALIGTIYAPLFLVLDAVLTPSLGHFSYAGAAAVAGGVGAAYYSARQAALAASVIGVFAALLVLLTLGDNAAFWQAAALCAVLGVLTGLAVDFPSRCTSNVLAKSFSGGLTGAASGAMLSIAAVLGLESSPFVAVAFLVSVNGVVYVASIRAVARCTGVIPRRWCPLTEGTLIAVVAVIVAGSVWAFATDLGGYERSWLFTNVVEATAPGLPLVLAAGLASGGVTGALLELFDFDWIDDL